MSAISDSTEGFYRGDKFSCHKSIKTFTEYLLVAQHRPHVSQFVKHGDGFWANFEFNNIDDTVELRSINVSLPLEHIYPDVVFPELNSPESGMERSTK